MEKVESKAVIEAILFAAGREVSIQELSMAGKANRRNRNYNKRNARRL